MGNENTAIIIITHSASTRLHSHYSFHGSNILLPQAIAWDELLSDIHEVYPSLLHLGICTNVTSSKRHSLTTGPKIACLVLNP